MPVAAGLVEFTPNKGHTEYPDVFYRDADGRLQVKLDNLYQNIRKTLKENTMMQYTQFAGTPIEQYEKPQFQKPSNNLFDSYLYDYYEPIHSSKNIVLTAVSAMWTKLSQYT
eukprot:UN15565